jgi:chromosome segregation ATPase
MERGINYTKEQKKRPRRLDTYEYKEHAKRQAEALKPVLKQKEKLKTENDSMLNYVYYNNRHFEEVEQENKFLNEELAKVKDFNKVNKEMREFLKSQGATRLDYANWEQVARELKERIKNKDLTISQLNEQREKRKKMFLEKIEELKKENKELKDKVYSKNYTIKINNKVVPATWQQVANSFKKQKEQKEEELQKEKKEKEELEEKLLKKEKIIKKLEEELNKIISKFNLEQNDNLLLTIKIISNALNSLKKEEPNNPEIMMENSKKLKEEADRIVNEIFDNNPFEEDEEYIAPTRRIKR